MTYDPRFLEIDLAELDGDGGSAGPIGFQYVGGGGC